MYNTPEDVFHVSMPKGWGFKYGGKKDLYWVSVEKGSATIKVLRSHIIGEPCMSRKNSPKFRHAQSRGSQSRLLRSKDVPKRVRLLTIIR